jgi:hypothetical protein
VRKVAAVLVVGGALAWAAPAGADQSSDAGCQAYGQAVAAAVQANVPAGAFVSGIATSGPGAAPAFVEGFKQAHCG